MSVKRAVKSHEACRLNVMVVCRGTGCIPRVILIANCECTTLLSKENGRRRTLREDYVAEPCGVGVGSEI